MSARQDYREARRQISRTVEHVFGSRAHFERVGWLIGYGRRWRGRKLTPEEAALAPVWRELNGIRTVLRNHADRIERLEDAFYDRIERLEEALEERSSAAPPKP